MIRSRLTGKAIAVLILLPLFFIAVGFLDWLVAKSLKEGIPKDSTGGFVMGMLYTIFINTGAVLYFLALRGKAFKITINTGENSITFKTMLTRHTDTYSFDFFDGYIETQSFGRGGNFNVYYFIKDGIAHKIISSYYYANMDELLQAIVPIKNLGFIKGNNTKLEWRGMFKKPLGDVLNKINNKSTP